MGIWLVLQLERELVLLLEIVMGMLLGVALVRVSVEQRGTWSAHATVAEWGQQ